MFRCGQCNYVGQDKIIRIWGGNSVEKTRLNQLGACYTKTLQILSPVRSYRYIIAVGHSVKTMTTCIDHAHTSLPRRLQAMT